MDDGGRRSMVFAPLPPSEPERTSRAFPVRAVLSIFAVVLLLGASALGVRALPCMVNADVGTWRVWGAVAPNLVCALDLSNHPSTAADLDSLKNFQNLTALNLSGAGLDVLPASVLDLGNLRDLTLDGNRLSALPPAIGDLGKLEHLSVQGNSISSLPDSLGNLRRLRSFGYSGNHIADLPAGIKSFAQSSSPLTGNLLGDDSSQSTPVSSAASSLAPTGTSSVGSATSTVASSVGLSSALSSIGDTPDSSPASVASSVATSSLVGGSQSSAGADESSVSNGASFDSSISADTSSSATAGSSVGFSSSREDTFSCTHNFTVNSYNLCLPGGWTPVSPTASEIPLADGGGTIVAKVTCPMQQTNYAGWTIVMQSRTYNRDGVKYGADLWSGVDTHGHSGSILLVFMHRNDLGSWFGNDYQDVGKSCQILSTDPRNTMDTFRSIFRSVY